MTSTNKLHNFLRTRRSIRRFKPDPIPDSVIENILSTATFAPSAHNRQPWRFCVVTNLSVKQKLANAMAIEFKHDLEQDQLPHAEIQKRVSRSRERIISAPVVIILNVDMTDMDVYPDEIAFPSLTASGQTPYTRFTSQFGFMGAYYFTSLRFSF